MKWHNNEWLAMWPELTIRILNFFEMRAWVRGRISNEIIFCFHFCRILVNNLWKFSGAPKSYSAPWCSRALFLTAKMTYSNLVLPKTVTLSIWIQQKILLQMKGNIALFLYAGKLQTGAKKWVSTYEVVLDILDILHKL